MLLESLPQSLRRLCRQRGMAGCRGEASGQPPEKAVPLQSRACSGLPRPPTAAPLQGARFSPVHGGRGPGDLPPLLRGRAPC